MTGIEKAGRVACRTLLFLGSRDSTTPPRGAKGVAKAIPDAETVVLEGAGHALLAERPDPVLDELIRMV